MDKWILQMRKKIKVTTNKGLIAGDTASIWAYKFEAMPYFFERVCTCIYLRIWRIVSMKWKEYTFSSLLFSSQLRFWNIIFQKCETFLVLQITLKNRWMLIWWRDWMKNFLVGCENLKCFFYIVIFLPMLYVEKTCFASLAWR